MSIYSLQILMRMNHPKTPIRVLTLILLLPLLPNSRGNYLNSPSPMPSLSTLGGVWPLPQKQELQDEYVSIVDSFKFKVSYFNFKVIIYLFQEKKKLELEYVTFRPHLNFKIDKYCRYYNISAYKLYHQTGLEMLPILGI